MVRSVGPAVAAVTSTRGPRNCTSSRSARWVSMVFSCARMSEATPEPAPIRAMIARSLKRQARRLRGAFASAIGGLRKGTTGFLAEPLVKHVQIGGPFAQQRIDDRHEEQSRERRHGQ